MVQMGAADYVLLAEAFQPTNENCTEITCQTARPLNSTKIFFEVDFEFENPATTRDYRHCNTSLTNTLSEPAELRMETSRQYRASTILEVSIAAGLPMVQKVQQVPIRLELERQIASVQAEIQIAFWRRSTWSFHRVCNESSRNIEWHARTHISSGRC